jgi:beta-N-acetylhexosaminidase
MTNALVDKMSLEAKVGQLMMVGFDGTSLGSELRRLLQEVRPGGVIFFERNVESPRQVAQLSNDFQQAAREKSAPGLLVAIDQEGGAVARLKEAKGFTEFPGAMAIAATGDLNNARRIGQAISGELCALGINVDFAPDMDVNNNPANPIIGTRSFGSDPKRVAEFGVAFLEAMQAASVLAIGKHFPGHGDTALDSHVALQTVPHNRERLQTVEFVPFLAAIRANVAGIMSAHITFPAIDPTPGLAGTLSVRVLSDLLRGEMRYEGLILTDELSMGALETSGYPAPRAAVAALKAGADLLLFQSGYEMHRQAFAALVTAVRSGEISEKRLDESVRRVLRAKERFGIVSPRLVDVEGAASLIGTNSTRRISRQVATLAITVIRDDSHLVPLNPNSKVLVVETLAVGLGERLGAETRFVSGQPTADEVDMVSASARNFDVVVALTNDVAKNQSQADLVEAIMRSNSALVVAAVRSPYDLLYLKRAPTYIATFGSNPPMMDALRDVLLGRVKSRGMLPVAL